jgi:hypothetical protein
VRLINELGVEIGERVCGSPAAERAAEAIAVAFRELGLEPRFQDFIFGHIVGPPQVFISSADALTESQLTRPVAKVEDA